MTATKNKSLTEEHKKGSIVTCMDCAKGCLHRYGNNPVLAACHAKPQPYNVRFPYEVEVANVRRKCEYYVHSLTEKTIEQRKAA